MEEAQVHTVQGAWGACGSCSGCKVVEAQVPTYREGGVHVVQLAVVDAKVIDVHTVQGGWAMGRGGRTGLTFGELWY